MPSLTHLGRTELKISKLNGHNGHRVKHGILSWNSDARHMTMKQFQSQASWEINFGTAGTGPAGSFEESVGADSCHRLLGTPSLEFS